MLALSSSAKRLLVAVVFVCQSIAGKDDGLGQETAQAVGAMAVLVAVRVGVAAETVVLVVCVEAAEAVVTADVGVAGTTGTAEASAEKERLRCD